MCASKSSCSYTLDWPRTLLPQFDTLYFTIILRAVARANSVLIMLESSFAVIVVFEGHMGSHFRTENKSVCYALEKLQDPGGLPVAYLNYF